MMKSFPIANNEVAERHNAKVALRDVKFAMNKGFGGTADDQQLVSVGWKRLGDKSMCITSES